MEDEGLQECGIEELYRGDKTAQFVPQVTPEYAWEFLEKRPYGSAIWEIALRKADREKLVIFMARETREDILNIPDRVDVLWRGLLMGWDASSGRRVAPVTILIYFIPLQTIYEVWFNFYGEHGKESQDALNLLANQKALHIYFHDRGPEAIRSFSFPNDLATSLHGYYGMLKAMPEWTDADFEEAKRRMMERYNLDDLWGLK